MRVFAGPNGSGKTTLAKNLIQDKKFKSIPFVNADDIEKEIQVAGYLDFNQFSLAISREKVIGFLLNTGMSIGKLGDESILNNIEVKGNSLYYTGQINSYIAADLAAFIREELMLEGNDFWFETVFSHSSKLEILKKAKSLGYRVYFYFIATDSPEINIDRVRNRVAKNGHSVPEDKIRSRYYKSLDLLVDAIKVSNRAFLFDNSQKASDLICQIIEGKDVEMKTESIPNWFIDYVYKKQ